MAEAGTRAMAVGTRTVVRWSWLQFVVPALLLLGLMIRHGPALYLLSGLYLLAGSLSVLGLMIQAATDRLCVQRSLGRGVNIALAFAVFTLIHFSLESTRRFVDLTATQVSDECKALGRCPQTIAGWERRSDRFVAQHMHQAWLRWPVLYHVSADGKEFDLWLYYALDSGKKWRGGVVAPAGEPAPFARN